METNPMLCAIRTLERDQLACAVIGQFSGKHDTALAQ